jgi:hypothetical protein
VKLISEGTDSFCALHAEVSCISCIFDVAFQRELIWINLDRRRLGDDAFALERIRATAAVNAPKA